MIHLIDFEYEDREGEEFLVTAEVRLGRTSARGDSPDEVLSLEAYDSEGDVRYLEWDEYEGLKELAIIETRSRTQ